MLSNENTKVLETFVFCCQALWQRAAGWTAPIRPNHGVASLGITVRIVVRKINVENDQQAHATTGGRKMSRFCQPLGMFANRRVARPGEVRG